MMFTSRARSSSPAKRDKPYTRKAKPLARSDSLLGTIKNIVSAPLSWFASDQEDFEDLRKRRRVIERDAGDLEEQRNERIGKRMRVDSPEHLPERVQPSITGTYLDPPVLRSQSAQLITNRNDEENGLTNKQTPVFEPSPPFDDRDSTVDPMSRYNVFSRDPTTIPLPTDSPVRSSPAGSLGPEDGLERSLTPFRLRTSLTPQPSSRRVLRRESSAPPPLSNLQSLPTFVKAPEEEKKEQNPSTQKTVSLGALADINRGSRTPSQNRILTSLGRTSIVSDQIVSSDSPDAILQPPKTRAEKAFHELEAYRTPILPSRYKESGEIPLFLKPKRSHVPVPMSKKDRRSRPSLGMSEKYEKETNAPNSRDDGKPYARTGGRQKLIARLRTEEEEERQRKDADATITSVEEDDEMETDVELPAPKRDVGVSTRLTSSSEDERLRSRNVPEGAVDAHPEPPSALPNPFSHQPTVTTTPGGRQQPYGRVGRTRTREPGQRSVPLPRPLNKLSAATNDVEIADAEDHNMVDATPFEKIYDVPRGFSFPSDTPIINLDVSRAKEPPIPSLPFSLGNRTTDASTDTIPKPQEPTSFKPPASTSSMFKPPSEQVQGKKADTPFSVPSVSVEPATPNQPVKEAKEKPALPNFFSAPTPSSVPSPAPGDIVAPSSAPKPAVIPNFFANSSFLASNKASTPAAKTPSPTPFTVPGSAPVTPMKDPENPLWDGNNAMPLAPPKLFAGAAKPFAFAAAGKQGDATSAPTIPTPLFGGQLKQPTTEPTGLQQPNASASAAPAGSTPFPGTTPSTAAEATQVQSVTKLSEPERKANSSGPSPFFNFGAGTTSNVPKPLFGTGSAATPAFPTQQPSQATQTTAAEAAPKQAFTFGQPQVSEGGNKPTSTQPPQSAPASAEQKSPSAFGAPPMASAASNTPASASNEAVTAPKPLFGSPSGGPVFTFGAPAAPATPTAQTAEAAKASSPFAFGAPPATPPAGGERQSSPFPFCAPAGSPTPTSTAFTFGTPVKQDGSTAGSAPSTPTNTSPFVFGAQSVVRPVTPPSKPDEGMNMEESPVQMDTNGGQKKPTGSISFGAGPTPVNPFGQNTSSGPAFSFGAPPPSNPFTQKDENKPSDTGGFNFNRTASAPTISTSFSFGAKSDLSTPPATAFGTPSNPFTSSGPSSTPFTFGQQQQQPTQLANPFGAPSQPSQATGAPGPTPSNPFSSTTPFTFGAPTAPSSTPFTFGSSAPSSPATGSTGLPQTSGTTGSTPAFTFGQPSGGTGGASGSSGGSLFNVGPPPPATNPGTPGRAIKKLPRRAKR